MAQPVCVIASSLLFSRLGFSGMRVWHTQLRQSQRASGPHLSIWKVLCWSALPPHCTVIAFTRTCVRYERRLDNLNLLVLIQCHCWLPRQSVSPPWNEKKNVRKTWGGGGVKACLLKFVFVFLICFQFYFLFLFSKNNGLDFLQMEGHGNNVMWMLSHLMPTVVPFLLYITTV